MAFSPQEYFCIRYYVSAVHRALPRDMRFCGVQQQSWGVRHETRLRPAVPQRTRLCFFPAWRTEPLAEGPTTSSCCTVGLLMPLTVFV
ncbi:uncharacterized protein EI97DRAFT_201776 [Westerdykella ornata]|uniref:Uncharacterized protein n=1 Tax=Westerdykella ornata TaxID=318751 RepID=A0A6A6JBS5_WESOR|nr:uncharacterized protein EI97DRAFT_201776 [Westerdykella ornata]KAF2272639.1 hypothetical protein EI97DRAFT_201776 [Westerdykella ornata]